MGTPPMRGCPECGLVHPCKTCGGGGKPKLALVPALPAERLYTRAEVLLLMTAAWSRGGEFASQGDEALRTSRDQRCLDINETLASLP